MLFLYELKQVLVLVKQFSFTNRSVSQTYITHMIHYFTIQLFANGGISSKHLNSENKVVYLARSSTQDLHNTDASDMHDTQ